MLAQNKEPNDCVNAVIVCGDGVFSSNASGFGKQEVSACGTGQEHNSIWLKITIAPTVVPGSTLGFDLIPNDPDITTDFDFWVYDAKPGCPTTLTNALRCCVTNPQQAGLTDNITGINGSTFATTAFSGPGGNDLPYVQWLHVNPGDTYYVVVDRPYNTASGDTGFQLKWTGTATGGAGAFPSTPTPASIADQVNCGPVGFFNLGNLRNQIDPDPNNTITFYASLADAVDGFPANQLPNLVAVKVADSPKVIYARDQNAIGCFTTTHFKLIVPAVPVASISASATQVCSGDNVTVTFTGAPVGAKVSYTIDNGPTQSGILNASGIFSFTESVLANRTYTLTRAANLDANGTEICFTDYTIPPKPAPVTVTVNAKPTISGTLTTCSNGTQQLTGSGTPNATTPWTSSDVTVATVDTTGLVNGFAGGTSDITYTDNNGCFAKAAFTVNALPTINGSSTICTAKTTQLTGSGTPAAVNPWVSSDPSVATVSSTGLVTGISGGTVTITYTDSNGCSQTTSMEVVATDSTKSYSASVSNYFSDNQTITVTVVGDATYIYSLDGGAFQESNVFNNVAPGLHTVTISDTSGCTDITIPDILTIGYPHFFTPNGDGQNETWNVSSLSTIEPNAEIFIFDRYAKLLKQITPGGAGWDGTYNGQNMPANDYWFTIRYNEDGVQKMFRAHFTLQR